MQKQPARGPQAVDFRDAGAAGRRPGTGADAPLAERPSPLPEIEADASLLLSRRSRLRRLLASAAWVPSLRRRHGRRDVCGPNSRYPAPALHPHSCSTPRPRPADITSSSSGHRRASRGQQMLDSRPASAALESSVCPTQSSACPTQSSVCPTQSSRRALTPERPAVVTHHPITHALLCFGSCTAGAVAHPAVS